MHQNDNDIIQPSHPNTLEIYNRILNVNNGKDLTDIEAVSNDGGDEHVIVGFLYAKRELVAYINSKTYVGEVYLESSSQGGSESLEGEETLGEGKLQNHLVGYITVDDLVRYLEDCPVIDGYLTSNESGVWH